MKLFYITLLSIFQLTLAISDAQEKKSDKEIEAEEAMVEFKKSETALKEAFLAKEKKFIRIWGSYKDNAQLKDLQASQTAWLKWRDLEASVLALEISEGGNLQGITETHQLTALNQARIKQLKAEGSDLEKEPNDHSTKVTKGIKGPENFANAIGDNLVDQPSSIYQGHLGQGDNSKGIFVLYWLSNKKVKGAFFPENGNTQYKIYGYNKVNGEINIQVYNGQELFCSGKLTKKKTKNKLVWSGDLSARSGGIPASMTKVTSSIPQGKAEARAYTTLAGFDSDTMYLTFHKNDTASAYLAPVGDDDEGDIYFQGVNYKKGYLFLLESGHFADNEAVVGAYLLLQKKMVQGSIVWQGKRYLHKGKTTSVSFGRPK